MWQDLLAAVALLLVLEGIVPFLSPGAIRRTLAELNKLEDRVLRMFGLVCMMVGVLMLYFVR